MAKKTTSEPKVKNIDSRSCYVRLLLYADNEKHMDLLNRIQYDPFLFSASTQWQYIGIAHTILDEDGKEVLEGDGKKHYHVYLAFKYPMRISALCRRFGFLTDLGEPDDQFVRCITGRFDNALVYLTHLNTPDKEQYSDSALFGSPALIERYKTAALTYTTKKIDKRQALSDALTWVSRQDGVITASQMLRYLLDSPSFCIRHEYWLREIWQSHNSRIYEADRKAYLDKLRQSAQNQERLQQLTDDELREMGFDV